jgi:hypothetical protein
VKLNEMKRYYYINFLERKISGDKMKCIRQSGVNVWKKNLNYKYSFPVSTFIAHSLQEKKKGGG